MLHVSDLQLVLGGQPVLHDLSLQVREAEIHSILGANGTGKSTLAAVLMGLTGYKPTSGRILFQGEEVSSLPISERARRGITLAWQEPARFEGLTIAEFLEISRQHAGNGFLLRSARHKSGLLTSPGPTPGFRARSMCKVVSTFRHRSSRTRRVACTTTCGRVQPTGGNSLPKGYRRISGRGNSGTPRRKR